MKITDKENILGQISEGIDHNKDMSKKVHRQPINLRLNLHRCNFTPALLMAFLSRKKVENFTKLL